MLRYHDGSSMVEHLNAFHGLINQMASLEVPLAYEVLAFNVARLASRHLGDTFVDLG